MFYLASPEGALFDVVKLKSGAGRTPEIVSWHVKDKSARISWGSNTAGALIDLKTGNVDRLAFRVDGVLARTTSLLGVASNGTELWAATADVLEPLVYHDWLGRKHKGNKDRVRTNYYSWTAKDGWKQLFSGINDVHPLFSNYAASTDGERVLLEIYSQGESGYESERSGPYGKPRFVSVRVKDASNSVVKPEYEASDGYCEATGWISDAEVALSCNSPLALDLRNGDTLPYDSASPPSQSARAATLLGDLGFTFDGLVDGQKAHEIEFDGPGSADIDLTGTAFLPSSGADVLDAKQVETGVVRVLLGGVGYYNLDTRNGSVHLQMPMYDPATGTKLVSATAVFYNEATDPTRTWVSYLGPNYGD